MLLREDRGNWSPNKLNKIKMLRYADAFQRRPREAEESHWPVLCVTPLKTVQWGFVMMKLLTVLLIATSTVPASATVLNYTLQNVTFDDGGTAYGMFTFDTDLGKATSVDITTTMGSVISGYHYNGISSGTNSSSQINFSTNGYGNFFIATAVQDGFSAGGVLALTTNGTSFEAPRLYRTVNGGSVTTDVPEPAMLGLFSFGAIGLGLGRSRKS